VSRTEWWLLLSVHVNTCLILRHIGSYGLSERCPQARVKALALIEMWCGKNKESVSAGIAYICKEQANLFSSITVLHTIYTSWRVGIKCMFIHVFPAES
jgi:hypothetical protein